MLRTDEEGIFGLRDATEFEQKALELFREQAQEVPVYKTFIKHLGVSPERVSSLEDIPFLPVSFFKTHRVLREGLKAERIFRSSGTSEAEERAEHHVADIELYDRAWSEAFQRIYGHPSSYRILALLPSYGERKDASLIHMVQGLMGTSGHPENGFFLDDLEGLAQKLQDLDEQGIATLLIGVSFALLDLAEQHPMELEHCIIMETGGMKGRRREMVRQELHQRLKDAFGVERVHSEYGMTELLSQAYSQGEGIFYPPPWMKVLVREIQDPFKILPHGRSGAINVVDLANRDSCAFLALDDLGRTHPDGSFEVLGRIDGSDVRGCNLLVE